MAAGNIKPTRQDIDSPDRMFQLLRAQGQMIESLGGTINELKRRLDERDGSGGGGGASSGGGALGGGVGVLERELRAGRPQPSAARLLLGLTELASVKHNLTAGAAPNGTPGTANSADDWTRGYSVGSVWINSAASGQAYILINTGAPAIGVAMWRTLTV
jgi:hypothetical protein